jgi:hypothetical protein
MQLTSIQRAEDQGTELRKWMFIVEEESIDIATRQCFKIHYQCDIFQKKSIFYESSLSISAITCCCNGPWELVSFSIAHTNVVLQTANYSAPNPTAMDVYLPHPYPVKMQLLSLSLSTTLSTTRQHLRLFVIGPLSDRLHICYFSISDVLSSSIFNWFFLIVPSIFLSRTSQAEIEGVI